MQHAVPCDYDSLHLRDEFKATQVQRELFFDITQWVSVELPLYGSCQPSIQDIAAAWHSLASHRAILRCYFWVQPSVNQLLVRVKRHAEKVTLAEPCRTLLVKGSPTTKTPYLVLKSGRHPKGHNQVHAHLRFHPALLDAESVDMIRIDFSLLMHGFPPVERMSFTFHNDYLANCGKTDEAEAFWAEVLSVNKPKVSLFTGTLSKKGFRRAEISDMGRLTVKTTINELGPDFLGRFGFTAKALCELVWANVLARRTDCDTILLATNGRDHKFFGSNMCMGQLDQVFPLPVATRRGNRIQDLALGIQAFRSVAASHAFIGMDKILGQTQWPQDDTQLTSIESLVSYAQSSFHQHDDNVAAPAYRRFPVVLNVVDGDGRLGITLSYVDAIPMAAADVALEGFVAGLRSAVHQLKLGGKPLLADITSTCRLGKLQPLDQRGSHEKHPAPDSVDSLVGETVGPLEL